MADVRDALKIEDIRKLPLLKFHPGKAEWTYKDGNSTKYVTPLNTFKIDAYSFVIGWLAYDDRNREDVKLAKCVDGTDANILHFVSEKVIRKKDLPEFVDLDSRSWELQLFMDGKRSTTKHMSSAALQI